MFVLPQHSSISAEKRRRESNELFLIQLLHPSIDEIILGWPWPRRIHLLDHSLTRERRLYFWAAFKGGFEMRYSFLQCYDAIGPQMQPLKDVAPELT